MKRLLPLLFALCMMAPLHPASAQGNIIVKYLTAGATPVLHWTDVSGEDHYSVGQQINLGTWNYWDIAADTTSFLGSTTSATQCFTLQALDQYNTPIYSSNNNDVLCNTGTSTGSHPVTNFRMWVNINNDVTLAWAAPTSGNISGYTVDKYDITNNQHHYETGFGPTDTSIGLNCFCSTNWMFTVITLVGGSPDSTSDGLSVFPVS